MYCLGCSDTCFFLNFNLLDQNVLSILLVDYSTVMRVYVVSVSYHDSYIIVTDIFCDANLFVSH